MKPTLFALAISLLLPACGDSRFEEAENDGTASAYENYLSGETTLENAERARDAIYALMLARAEDADESERITAYMALFSRFERELPAESRRRYAHFQLELLRSADRSTASTSADAFREAANAHFTAERDVTAEGEEIIAARATALVAEGLMNAPTIEARAASATYDSDALGLWRTDTGVRARLRNSDHRTYTEALYRLQITSADGSERSVDWPLLHEARLSGGDVVEASLDIPGLEASDRVVMEPVSGERR